MSRFFGGRFGDMIPSSSAAGLEDNSGVFSSRDQYTSKQEGGWAVVSSITASGGTVSTYNDPTGQGWKVHKFESSGTFDVTKVGSGAYNQVDYLLIAGGAGGGGMGGGGAGGLIYKTGTSVSVATYPVTIGAGGAVIDSPGGVTPKGNNGADSVFALDTSVTAKGGGGGAGWDQGNPSGYPSPGGSGGGAGTPNTSETANPGTGPGHPGAVDLETPGPFITAGGWGNSGGNGTPGAYYGGGGGGAQGQGVGANPGPGVAGGGGNGAQYTILTGNPAVGNRWAGGGGGGQQSAGTSGYGGKGGGGGGGSNPGGSGGTAPNPGDPNFTDYNAGEAGRVSPSPGPQNYGYGGSAGANTGSGGGGMAVSVGRGGAGGSGILIVRYKT